MEYYIKAPICELYVPFPIFSPAALDALLGG